MNDVMELEKVHLLQNYARYPLVLSHGEGARLFDLDGRAYLDLISGIGVNALGYNHPRITAVIQEQAAKLIHTSNLYYHQFQGPLANRIAQASGLDRVFFGNTGTEVVEGALKMARAHGTKIDPKKFGFVSLENSFHGRTLGALSVTGQPKYRNDFEPLLPGIGFVPKNNCEALEAAIGPDTAAFIVEVIQGEGGIFPICRNYLMKARELCTKFNALLIFDETQCGVGRPGSFFAYQQFHPVIMPDVMVAAKPIACGLPLGFIAATEAAAAAISPGMHGSTFGGGPLSCRVALEFFDILDELMPQIQRVGAYFRKCLLGLAEKHDSIYQVRGQGLMLGMEMKKPCADLVTSAMSEGLLINCTHGTTLRFLPPYILTESDVDEAVSILDRVIAKANL